MWTAPDETFLRRAMRIAMNGRGYVEPNPMVGCVLVKNDKIIGEGYHAGYGKPHAEPTALAACTESAKGATAYVTLEPCCHTNKQTPPCAPRLMAEGIARVVIGCTDPNTDVDGKGISMLRDARITVDLAPEAIMAEFRQFIAPFTVRQRFERPYITMKWAQTADRKIAGHEGMRLQISGEQANREVHKLRTRSDAILVGINTVLVDNPSLTVRDVPVIRRPERVVLDHKLRTPINSRLVQTALQVPTVVVSSLKAPSTNFEPLVTKGVRVVWPPAERDDLLRAAISSGDWVKKSYAHVLVEAGPTLANAFFKSNLCDRLWIITSGNTLADSSAPSAADVPSWFVKTGERRLGGDLLEEFLNEQSSGFAARVESTDLHLISA